MERDDDFDDIYGVDAMTTPVDDTSSDDSGYQPGSVPGDGASSTETGGAPSPSRDSDPEAVAAARARLEEADKAMVAAGDRLAVAEDALADAEGQVAVAEFKVADYEADESLPEWKKASAREELSRAKRGYKRAASRLGAATVALEDAEAAASSALEELRRAESTPTPKPTDGPVQRFASLPVFVVEYVVPNWVHKLGESYGGRWCSQWWEHPEAVTRLSALWEAFEVMRNEPPPSLSTWIKDHLDAHMAALTQIHGVFHNCDVNRHVHESKEAWETGTPPEGMFAVNPKAVVQPRQSATDTNGTVQADHTGAADAAGHEEKEGAHV